MCWNTWTLWQCCLHHTVLDTEKAAAVPQIDDHALILRYHVPHPNNNCVCFARAEYTVQGTWISCPCGTNSAAPTSNCINGVSVFNNSNFFGALHDNLSPILHCITQVASKMVCHPHLYTFIGIHHPIISRIYNLRYHRDGCRKDE